MKTLIKIIAVSIVILVLSSTSFAVYLYSPPVTINDTIECTIVNVGDKPMTVSITACDSVTCVINAPYPNVSPGTIVKFSTDAVSLGYCQFNISGKPENVRASACIINTTTGNIDCLSAQ